MSEKVKQPSLYCGRRVSETIDFRGQKRVALPRIFWDNLRATGLHFVASPGAVRLAYLEVGLIRDQLHEEEKVFSRDQIENVLGQDNYTKTLEYIANGFRIRIGGANGDKKQPTRSAQLLLRSNTYTTSIVDAERNPLRAALGLPPVGIRHREAALLPITNISHLPMDIRVEDLRASLESAVSTLLNQAIELGPLDIHKSKIYH